MSHWLRRALVLVLLALGLPSALAAVTPSRTIHESFTTNTCLPSSVTLIQQHAPTVEATLCDDPDSGSWEVVPASELAAGPSSSDDATLDLVLLAGWPKGGQIRITLRPALVDGFGRALQIPAGEDPSGVRVAVRIPPTDEPPALDRRWPLRFDSGYAAANSLGGAFPGGQTSLYQGLWTDPVTGLAYARARWYDTRTASWLSEDPVGTFDSPNLYAFVAWQPHMYRDPSGESLWTAYRDTKEAIGSVLAHPRVQGTMQVAQGAMEIAIGAAGAKTGLGLMAVAHGSDTSAAGLVALITGEAQITATHRAARDLALLAGANEGVAEQVGFWTDMAVGTAASIGAARARAARAPPGVGDSRLGSGKPGLSERIARTTAPGPAFSSGREGEAYLRRLLGASPEKGQVAFGKGRARRVLDVLVDGIGHESKVGYVPYSRLTARQILKDAALIKTMKLEGAHWHFFRSAVTGQVGADPRVLRLLRRFDIQYTIH